ARLLEPAQAVRLLAVAARIEVHHRHALGAQLAEQGFVARCGLVYAAPRPDHDDIGVLAAGDLDEAPQDAGIVLLVLRSADRDDPAAACTVRDSAWTHALVFLLESMVAARPIYSVRSRAIHCSNVPP